MDADDYVPRIFEEDLTVHSDSSKWAAVHGALDNNTTSHAGSGAGSLFTVAWVLGITLGLLWILRNGRTVLDQWQNNVYRRANRRRHGIPDDDDRPFNVAYAAAALARKEREQQEKKRFNNSRHQPPQLEESGWARHGQTVDTRQRSSHATGPSSSTQRARPIFGQEHSFRQFDSSIRGSVAGGNATHNAQFRSQQSTPQASSPLIRSNHRSAKRNDGQELLSLPTSLGVNSRRMTNVDAADHAQPERRKHHQVSGAADEDRTKKRTRVDGEDLIDGNNDAAWAPGGSRRGSLQATKRGSKRHANPEEDDAWEMSQDKRARKGSFVDPDNESDTDDANDFDMGRDPSDTEPEPTRGTKRGREDHDSAIDSQAYDTDESRRPRPARKRWVGEVKKGEVPPSRGRKRDRSHERSTASDDEDQSYPQIPRHKRGRRYEEPEDDADIILTNASESEDLPDIAEDPACGGRRVGETWEVNGQRFKVGLDGRRLRHALIKQWRTKFAMPRDSAHSDAKSNVDVVVEKWLNDNEYKAAKENLELAWQDSNSASAPNKVVSSVQDDQPTSGGKRLLWAGPPSSPIKGARASVRIPSRVQNPFELAPSNAGRRVASAHLLMNNPGESPKLRSAKSFSKWEKQDLEANSLKKMRARMEKEKKEKDKQQEKEKEQQEKEQQRQQDKAKVAQPSVPIFTPLVSTTNTQCQPPPSTQANPDAKQGLSSVVPSPDLLAPQASRTASAPTINFSPLQPASTTNPGLAVQPSNVSPFMFPTSVPATTATIPAKSPFSLGHVPASTPSEPSKSIPPKPLFNLGTIPSTSSSSTTTTAVTTSKPPFSFSAKSAEPTKSDGPKPPTFNFATPPATSSEPSKTLFSNPFAKMASQQSSTPSAIPATNSPFNFNPAAQPSQPATNQRSAFSFNPTSAQSSNQNTPVAQPTTGPGTPSLLNRLASPTSAQPSQMTQNTWSTPGATLSATLTNASHQPSTTNFFGQNQTQSRNLSDSFNKPTPFVPNSSRSEPPKNVFGTPSSSTPIFSFPKAPSVSDTSKPTAQKSFFAQPSGQPEASTSQSKSPFSFNFPSSTPGSSTTSATSSSINPFNPNPTPSTTSAAPGAFAFKFGQPSSTTSSSSNSNPFGFEHKAADGEK